MSTQPKRRWQVFARQLWPEPVGSVFRCGPSFVGTKADARVRKNAWHNADCDEWRRSTIYHYTVEPVSEGDDGRR